MLYFKIGDFNNNVSRIITVALCNVNTAARFVHEYSRITLRNSSSSRLEQLRKRAISISDAVSDGKLGFHTHEL